MDDTGHIVNPLTSPALGAHKSSARYERLDDEAALWRRWEDHADETAREVIVRHYMAYARALAAKLYARRTHDEFEFQEYLQFASVGLVESVNRFRSEYGAQFKTYATTRINGAILNGLASLSERQQQIEFRRRVSEERLTSLKEVDGVEEGEELLRELAGIGIGLALGYLLEGTGMIASEESSVPDTTYSRAEMAQMQRQVASLTRQLTGRERDVIRMHYQQNLNFEEIAREMQLSKGRISQIHKQGIVRLRLLISQINACDIAL